MMVIFEQMAFKKSAYCDTGDKGSLFGPQLDVLEDQISSYCTCLRKSV